MPAYTSPVKGVDPWFGFHARYKDGSLHYGNDYAVPAGTPVYAPASGTVVVAGWSTTGYGWQVRIRDQWGVTHILGHNSKLLVSVGQRVTQGQQVSLSGNSGHSTGDHVHWETRTVWNDQTTAFDALIYLISDAVSAGVEAATNEIEDNDMTDAQAQMLTDIYTAVKGHRSEDAAREEVATKRHAYVVALLKGIRSAVDSALTRLS